MTGEVSHLLVFLAGILVINSFLIALARSLKIADFIAHLLTGVALGFIVLGIESLEWTSRIKSWLGMDAGLPSFPGSPAIRFLAFLGLFLLLMDIGFTFDFKFFRRHRLSEAPILLQSLMLLGLNILGLGAVGYLMLKQIPEGQTTVLAIAAFIAALVSLNVGTVLTTNFPTVSALKKPFTNLVQVAVVLDVVALVEFALLHFVAGPVISPAEALAQSLVPLLIVGACLVLMLFPPITRRGFALLEKWIGEYTLPLKIALVLLFVYGAFQLFGDALALLPLIGFGAGVLMRVLSGNRHLEVRRQFFPVASFFYMLPFVYVGYGLVRSWAPGEMFWPTLDFTLLALALISLVFGFFVLRRGEYPILLSFAVFPRGELAVLLLWLAQELGWFPAGFFSAAVAAVVVSSLIGRVLFIWPLEAQPMIQDQEM
ncbi:MAG: hypothetical protein D6681_12450 [Calditrichaeota bacterium]|nr:MAG: hypothetical protein D6681_12450 [Calditrichota bacterium]